jgi:hypothetical protein
MTDELLPFIVAMTDDAPKSVSCVSRFASRRTPDGAYDLHVANQKPPGK